MLIKHKERLIKGKAIDEASFRNEVEPLSSQGLRRRNGETNKSRAESWIVDQLKKGFPSLKKSSTLAAFATDWWVREKCPHIRAKRESR